MQTDKLRRTLEDRRDFYIERDFNGESPTRIFETLKLTTMLSRDMEVLEWYLDSDIEVKEPNAIYKVDIFGVDSGCKSIMIVDMDGFDADGYRSGPEDLIERLPRNIAFPSERSRFTVSRLGSTKMAKHTVLHTEFVEGSYNAE